MINEKQASILIPLNESALNCFLWTQMYAMEAKNNNFLGYDLRRFKELVKRITG